MPRSLLAWVLLLFLPAVSKPAELKPETLNASDEYIQAAASRMRARLDGKSPFLWIDEAPGLRQQVRRGEILVSPVGGSGRRGVPHGFIHDWIGAVFIPNATLDEVFAVVHDYDHYKDYYKTTVIDSRLLGRNGNECRFSMRWLKKVLLVTAVVETEYYSPNFRLDDKRWYSLAWSTRVQEIRDYGEPANARYPRIRGTATSGGCTASRGTKSRTAACMPNWRRSY
jgi:hypothetical protein